MADNTDASGAIQGAYTYGVATSPLQTTAAKGGSNLDKDAFLKLLLAQMKYQDPLNPMDDKEFVAQMAQFTALEQMQNLNASYAKSQAYDMIGRTVTGTAYIEATNSYVYVDGIVSEVKIMNGEPYLVVGTGSDAVDLQLTRVETIGENYAQLSMMQSINNNVYNQENLMLVGQYVLAVTVDENGKPNGYVEGVVDAVRFGVNGSMLVVGNREVSPAEVISVGESGGILGKEVSCWVRGESGEMEWFTGTLTEVKFAGDNMYAVVGGKEVPFENLDHLSKALGMVGSNVVSYGVESTVSSVGIQSGVVYLLLQDGRQLLISDVKLTA